jgi:hypothetical protein
MSAKRRPPGQPIADIFIQERQATEKKLALMKKEIEEKEVEPCTFDPFVVRSTSTHDLNEKKEIPPKEGGQSTKADYRYHQFPKNPSA